MNGPRERERFDVPELMRRWIKTRESFVPNSVKRRKTLALALLTRATLVAHQPTEAKTPQLKIN